MNVKQLIEELQKHNPDDLVVVNGYEGGVSEVKTLEKMVIALDVHDQWYYGAHEEIFDEYDKEKYAQKTQAEAICLH
jgi:hypothetical protein